MTAYSYDERTMFDRIIHAVIVEPLTLATSQIAQALISAASAYLVYSEAVLLVSHVPALSLAIGAEWAYLKGLSSGSHVKTQWTRVLIISAIALVVIYGSLWSLRKFGVLPADGVVTGSESERWIAAIIITACHILPISAVTISSAMVHAAELAAERERKEQEQAQRIAEQQEQQRRIAEEAEHERQRQRDLQAQRDALALEAERKQLDLTVAWKQQQLRREARATNATHQNASTANANNAVQERIHANHAINAKCPHCDAPLKNMAAVSAAHRWGHCAQCKKEKK